MRQVATFGVFRATWQEPKAHLSQLLLVWVLCMFERFWKILQFEPRQAVSVEEPLKEAQARQVSSMGRGFRGSPGQGKWG